MSVARGSDGWLALQTSQLPISNHVHHKHRPVCECSNFRWASVFLRGHHFDHHYGQHDWRGRAPPVGQLVCLDHTNKPMFPHTVSQYSHVLQRTPRQAAKLLSESPLKQAATAMKKRNIRRLYQIVPYERKHKRCAHGNLTPCLGKGVTRKIKWTTTILIRLISRNIVEKSVV